MNLSCSVLRSRFTQKLKVLDVRARDSVAEFHQYTDEFKSIKGRNASQRCDLEIQLCEEFRRNPKNAGRGAAR